MKLEESMKKIDRTTDPLYLDAWFAYFKPKFEESFARFFKENGHYPTSTEMDSCEYLPSTRLLQRNYGGICNFRKALGLEILDYTKGDIRKKTASDVGKRALIIEKEICDFLVEKFGEKKVHREYQPFDDRRCRADFKIFAKNKQFIIDVFFPKHKDSLLGCLNSKMKKYNASFGKSIFPYPVIFLQMNKDLSSDFVKKIVENKKNKLYKNQSVMCIDEFKSYCHSQLPLL